MLGSAKRVSVSECGSSHFSAFISFLLCTSLLVRGPAPASFSVCPEQHSAPLRGRYPSSTRAGSFRDCSRSLRTKPPFFLTQTSAAASVVASLPDGRDPQLLPGKGTVLHLVWYRYRCYGVFPCHTSPPGSCRAWVEHFKEPGPGMLGKRSIFFQLIRSFSLRVGSDDAAKTAVLPSFCSCTVIRAALASGLDRDQLLVVWKF